MAPLFGAARKSRYCFLVSSVTNCILGQFLAFETMDWTLIKVLRNSLSQRRLVDGDKEKTRLSCLCG